MDLNIRCKATKFVNKQTKNTGENYSGDKFLNFTSKAQSIREKVSLLSLIKIKKFDSVGNF